MELAVRNFAFDENLVRVVVRDDDPWFVADDVGRALGIAKVRNTLADFDDDEKGAHSMGTPGGEQRVIVLSEPGLYRLIFMSRKPEARRFQRWVTHEVLPAIRRTGRYGETRDAGPSGVLASARDMADAPLLHRLYLLDRVTRLHGKAVARVMYAQLGLPPVPPPPQTDRDEARIALRHFLDMPVASGDPLRTVIERAMDEDEEARALALSAGVRVYPEREAFVIASRAPHVIQVFKGQDLGTTPMRLLRRLPGVVAAAAARYAGLVSRGVEVPALYLD